MTIDLRLAVKRATGDAAPPPWPQPDMRLVEDDRAPAPVLEEDALPYGWGEWIVEEAAARGCPADYIAAALITAAAAWIGNSRHISATPSWTQPPHLWVALIGPPSAGKTPALQAFVEASRALERKAEPFWLTDCARHALTVEIAKEAEERWRSEVKTATKEGVPPPERPTQAEVPPAPPRPRTIAMDTTTEELQHLLSEQPRGLLYKRDELVGWFGNHDRYGGHGGDRAFYLEAWDGGALFVDRVKTHGAPLQIARTALAILGGLQPDRLREVLAGADDGLAARLAYVWPDPAPIQRLTSGGDVVAMRRRDQLLTAAGRLYGLRMVDGASVEPGPQLLPLTDPAFRLFDDLRCSRHEQLADWLPVGTAKPRTVPSSSRSFSSSSPGPRSAIPSRGEFPARLSRAPGLRRLFGGDARPCGGRACHRLGRSGRLGDRPSHNNCSDCNAE